MSSLRNLVSTVTGTATGVASGSAVSGNSVFMGGRTAKVRDLSALVGVTANTNTITLAARWQVSNDASTWYTVAHGSQNAAAVVMATGITPQADVALVRVIPAPEAVYGYKYSRAQVVVGVVTGTTNDTYSIGYSYRQYNQGELAR